MGKRLVDVIIEVFRIEHYSYRTEETYLYWIKRFIAFHSNKHPRDLGAAEIQQFLSGLALEHHVSASTQNQALSAILFLYKKVLGIKLPWMDEIVRAKRPKKVPVVMTRSEIIRVLECMQGRHWLMASLLYGGGLRMVECLRLRIQDIDFNYLQITIRNGKGAKDRHTILAETLIPNLKMQFENVNRQLQRDIALGKNGVSLPGAIDRKYRRASLDWKWQYVFPATRYAYIRHNESQRRHHSHAGRRCRTITSSVHLQTCVDAMLHKPAPPPNSKD